jgi:hypothetical protein
MLEIFTCNFLEYQHSPRTDGTRLHTFNPSNQHNLDRPIDSITTTLTKHFTNTKSSCLNSHNVVRTPVYRICLNKRSYTVIRIRLYENTLLISHRTHPSPHFIPRFSTHAIPDNQRDTQENSPHSAKGTHIMPRLSACNGRCVVCHGCVRKCNSGRSTMTSRG